MVEIHPQQFNFKQSVSLALFPRIPVPNVCVLFKCV